MAAPSSVGERRLRDALLAFFFFLHVFYSAAGTEEGASTAEFDVRPGGMVHSFSKSLVRRGTCTSQVEAADWLSVSWQPGLGMSRRAF